MFPLMIPMLIGAAGGALMNKKDPLKGALLGGGMGAAGGLLAPAAMGGAAAGASGASGASAPAAGFFGSNVGAGVASQGFGGAAAGMGAGAMAPIVERSTQAAAGSWSPGLFERFGMSEGLDKAGGLLGQAEKFTKPMGTAMNVAGAMRPPEQSVPQAPPPPPATGPAGMAQLAQQQNQVAMGQRQYDMESRKRRQDLLNRMMG